MKKKNYRNKKSLQKRRETIFVGVLIALAALAAVFGVIDLFVDKPAYTVTADGHIHAADGTHVGTVEELTGDANTEVVITDEGHIHAADGTHIGSIGEDAHDHAEEEAAAVEGETADSAEGETAEEAAAETAAE